MTNENGNHNGISNGNGELGELTGLQRAFVDAWFTCRFNGTAAAREAGYQGTDATLASIASQNLRKLKVQAEIAKRWASHGASGEEVLARLAGWMRFNPAVLFDEHGRIVWSEVKSHGENVKRIEYKAGEGFKVEVHDPMKAAELIGKFLLVGERKDDGGLVVIVDI